MKIRLIRPFRIWREGQVIEPPDGQANVMIERGYAEKYLEPPAKPSKSDQREYHGKRR